MRGPSPLPAGFRGVDRGITSGGTTACLNRFPRARSRPSLLEIARWSRCAAGYRTAPISDREKALFAFIEKVNRESSRLRVEDVEEVKASGWSDEALYDAITVCALFNFYNKWIDATGGAICRPPLPDPGTAGDLRLRAGERPVK